MIKKQPIIVRQVAVDIAVVSNKVDNIQSDLTFIKSDIKDIKSSMEADYVSRTEFAPIQKIVYGMISLILVAVFGALIALVVKQ